MHVTMILLNTLNPFWDKNIIGLIDGIKIALPTGTLASVARELAANFSLVYLSVKAYMMIAGEGRFEIMPLFRPFIISLAIINFGLVTQLVGLPGNESSKLMAGQFEENTFDLDRTMDEKDSLNNKLFNTILHNTDSIATQLGLVSGTGAGPMDGAISGIANNVTGGALQVMSNFQSYIIVYEQLIWAKISLWLQGFIEWCVVSLFKGICYCIFFLQVVLLAVLTWTGPISFAFSIGGPFKDSWVHWAGKYIAVSFYSTIGYFILNVSFAIFEYGLKQEIQRLQDILALEHNHYLQFLKLTLHLDNFMPYVIIAMITAVAGIVATPIISTWIVQTAGTGSAIFGGAVNAAQRTAGAAGKAAKAVATGGVGAAL